LRTYTFHELYESDENNRDQTLIETDTKTVLDIKNSNASKSGEEITCSSNILTDLNTSTRLINNKVKVLHNKFTTQQINLFNKTEIELILNRN